jgi:hypothetical protein
MRWQLSLVLVCTTLACAPENKPSKQTTKEPKAAPGEAQAQQEPQTQEGQSFHDGMVALCESYAKAPKSDDPAESQKLLHGWLEENVTNEKVREVFTMVGEMPPSQRAGMMRAAAAKVGITKCALAGE